MSSFRYQTTTGRWYKGNCHVHSTASDGGKTVGELAEMYAGEGYDFLFLTDHWVVSDLSSNGAGSPPLWLDGVEIHGRDETGSMYHVVCLGALNGTIGQDMGFVAALEAARAQGALLILAHPHWMGNSFEDALRWDFDGVEIYNHVCRWLNGKGDGRVHWNAMLERAPKTLGLAVDDAHIRPEHPGWNGGWIMVNAPVLSREAILDAIRAGHFYSTCGPEFRAIEYDGLSVHVETSAVQFARLVGPAHWGKRMGSFDDQRLTEATFEIPKEWAYAYLEIEDACGRHAWTNTLFVA